MEKNSPDRPAGSRFRILVLAIAAAAAVISILAVAYTRPPVLQFDENYYYPLARQIASGGFEDGYVVRPPLYPIFLAFLIKIVGTGFQGLLIVESFLRGLLILGIAYIGKRYFSPLAGLISAMLLAVYPLLIWTYTRFMTEIIYVPLFLASFYFIDKAVASEQKSHWLLAGFLSGLATLARSTSLAFTLIVAIWLIVRRSPKGRFERASLTGAALLTAALIATISPWMIRNAVVHKALIPVDNAAAFNLYLITSGKKIHEAEADWSSWGGQAERQREAYRRWRAYLRTDPAFHLRRMATVLPRLFNPFGHPSINTLSTISRGVHTRPNPGLRRLLTIVVPAVFWIITAGGIAGLAVVERHAPRRALAIITVVYFVLLHAMTLARPRFLLPMNAVLAIYAGALIAWALPRLGWTRRDRP